MTSIYREKALESRAQGFSNPIDIKGNLPVSLTMVGLAAVLVGFILFAWFNTYIRRVEVVGYIAPSTGSVEIISPVSGRLLLDIANGGIVGAGDRLATVDTEGLSASGRSSVDDKVSALERQIEINQAGLALLTEQLAALKEEAASAMRLQATKAEMAEAELALAQADLDLAQSRSDELARLQQNRLATDNDVVANQREALSARRIRLDVEQRLALVEDEGRQMELEYRSRELEVRRTMVTVQRDTEEMEAQIERLNLDRTSGVFAPMDGTVVLASAQNRETVSAGQQLFKIEPLDDELIGVLLAPTSAIGFVEVGDTVQIRYRAFPHREHGVFTAEVTEIDQTAQTPNDIDAPVAVSEPVFRVRVQLDQAPVNKAGATLRLGSGMLFDASIVVDEKRLLLWILAPVL